MDWIFDLLPLILIVWVASASGKKGKKGKNRQERKNARRASKTGRPQEELLGEAMQKADRAQHKPADADQAARNEQDCEQRPIHLHEVSQQVMQAAGEGEDPCHAGGAPEETPFDEEAEQAHSALAQDVLRGVIMSEILTRPQQRAAMNRRSMHG